MRALRFLLLTALLLWLLPLPHPALAEPLDVRAKYEDVLVATALMRHHLVPDPDPQGKWVEEIVIDASKVILPGDFPLSSKIPWTLANYVHVRTRQEVIARELLFSVQQPYDRDLVEESGRNLRRLPILSVARLVAARGSARGRVKILVVTKDQWSLRLNTNFSLDQSRLDSLSFSFAEGNVAGRYKQVALNFALDPGRYTLGLAYTDPRIWGSRHQLAAGASLFLDRSSSQPEGATASLSLGRPLFSLNTKWAWAGQLYFLQDKARSFRGGDVRPFSFTGSPPIPWIYGRHIYSGFLEATRSFGVLNKVNLTAGFQGQSADYGLTDEFPQNVPDAARAAFLAYVLPPSERTVGPYVSLSAYRADYTRLKNIDTFALTEDFRIGPQGSLGVQFFSQALGSTADFAILSASYGHTALWGDDLLSFAVSASTRVQQDRVPGTVLVNESLSASFRNVSPLFRFFRLHTAARFLFRGHDITNSTITLGQDNGLRGFTARSVPFNTQLDPTDYTKNIQPAGQLVYIVNIEMRTLALNLWTLHVGGVLFYDGGDAPQAFVAYDNKGLPQGALTPGWHQDVGLGLRILIPQFNHDVLRLDLAFPLEREQTLVTVPDPGPGILSDRRSLALATLPYTPRFSASFNQAF